MSIVGIDHGNNTFNNHYNVLYQAFPFYRYRLSWIEIQYDKDMSRICQGYVKNLLETKFY